MRGELKMALKQLVLFSFLLAVLQLLVFVGLNTLAIGETIGKAMTYQFYAQFLRDLLPLAILFWAFYRIVARMKEANYGKIVGSALVLLLLAYHVSFLLRTIYFYWMHPNYVDPDVMGISSAQWPGEVAKHGFNLFLPHYSPLHYLLRGVLSTILHFRSPLQIIPLLLNPILLSVWVSTVVWLMTKKKNHYFHKELTIDNE